MADQLDPKLEARLRAALHDEADAVPFTLRGGELERLASVRQRTQRSQRLAVLAMAAVVVVAVAGIAGFARLRGPGPAAPDPLAQLPSFGELTAIGGGGTELLREEAQPLTTDGQWQYGLPQGVGNLRIAIACSGGSVHLSTSADGSPVDDLGTGPCDDGAMAIGIGANPRLSAAASASIEVQAPAGTVWRMIVFATANAPTPAGPPPPTTALPAGCTLIRQANQARIGVNGFAGAPTATNIGIVTYARIGTDAPVGSLTDWPITELGLLATRDGGGLNFDAGRFCVLAWNLSFGQTADIQAAIAGGQVPSLQAWPATSSDSNTFAATRLPAGASPDPRSLWQGTTREAQIAVVYVSEDDAAGTLGKRLGASVETAQSSVGDDWAASVVEDRAPRITVVDARRSHPVGPGYVAHPAIPARARRANLVVPPTGMYFDDVVQARLACGLATHQDIFASLTVPSQPVRDD